jgi:hypothetical protein
MATASKHLPAPAARTVFERRWPAALTILAVLFLLQEMPVRVRLAPPWVLYVIAIVAVIPMIAVGLTKARASWVRVERIVLGLFILVTEAGTVITLAFLIRSILGRSIEIDGLQLLASSIAVWIANVLSFSLLYWLLDRGGPEARARHEPVRPDWQFANEAATSKSPAWRPGFVDYLSLGFTAATAFSPTDTPPLTSRAKLLMMLESTISLGTILIVAARAINVLGN